MPNPQYSILQTSDLDSGTFYTVKLIPDMDPSLLPKGMSNTDFIEEQTYLVLANQDYTKVLSIAAWNHQNELTNRFQPAPNPDVVVIADPVTVTALPLNQLS